MKQLFVSIVALLTIILGGIYLTTSANNISKANSNAAGFCLDAGCTGGTVKCYTPPEGGTCWTADVGQEDQQIRNN